MTSTVGVRCSLGLVCFVLALGADSYGCPPVFVGTGLSIAAENDSMVVPALSHRKRLLPVTTPSWSAHIPPDYAL
jgi:hypothetical protein